MLVGRERRRWAFVAGAFASLAVYIGTLAIGHTGAHVLASRTEITSRSSVIRLGQKIESSCFFALVNMAGLDCLA